MFSFSSLRVPVVSAPMAGYGPPALARAVGAAGGFGFLAAGNKSPAAVEAEISEVAADSRPYGINLFVPDTAPLDDDLLAALSRYREELSGLAECLGVEIAEPVQDSDGWEEKVEIVTSARVPVVSFTFGLPGREVVDALHAVDSAVVVTVQSVDDARLAADGGADALVVQGPEAGGHRSTFSTDVEPDPTPLAELFPAVRAAVDLPLLASGGISTGAALREYLDAGAVAAQIGTAFLLSDEAGTTAAHRAALRDPHFAESRATRAYTGRYARGLLNDYGRRFEPLAPAVYPALQRMVAPVRAAASAAGEAEQMPLWAGANWRDAPAGPAGEIVADLWAGAR